MFGINPNGEKTDHFYSFLEVLSEVEARVLSAAVYVGPSDGLIIDLHWQEKNPKQIHKSTTNLSSMEVDN